MKALRRWLWVVFLAGLAGIVVRMRGRGGEPPVTGGWRELRSPDFR
ncbi:MAG: hypothetical protein ACOYNI_01200 [Acidimicrobiia bacterium]